MGIMQQYECPKCGYKPPILHFGCGFHLSYKVYVCMICKVVQSSVYHIHCSYRKDEEKEYREKQAFAAIILSKNYTQYPIIKKLT